MTTKSEIARLGKMLGDGDEALVAIQAESTQNVVLIEARIQRRPFGPLGLGPKRRVPPVLQGSG